MPSIKIPSWAPCLRSKVLTVTTSRLSPRPSWHKRCCITWTSVSFVWCIVWTNVLFLLCSGGIFLLVLCLSVCAPVSPFPSLPSARLVSIAGLCRTFFSLQNVATRLLPLGNSADNQENAFQHDEVS